jgi:hypothetical protein
MTPEELQAFKEILQKLRIDMLCAGDGGTFSLNAEQFFLLSINDLDSALRHLTLAKYAQMQGR